MAEEIKDAQPKHVSVGSQESSDPSKKKLGATLLIAATALAAFLVFLDSSIIVPAIPLITQRFGSITDIGCCVSQPLIGKAFASFPLKTSFVSTLVIFEAGSLICALAVSSPMFIVGRAIAGVGSAGLLNGSLAVVTVLSSIEKRAGTIGMVLAKRLMSDRTPGFYINLLLAIPIIAAMFLIPCPRYALGYVEAPSILRMLLHLDWPGFVLFAGGVTMFLLALQFGSGGKHGWGSATVIGLFVGAGVCLIVFIIWEQRKGQSALVPLKTLTKLVVFSSSVTFLLQMGNLIIALYYLPLWFQLIKNASPIDSGVYLLPMIGTQILAVIVSAVISKKTGQHLPFALFNGVLVAIGSGMTIRFDRNTSTGYWIGAELLIGAGRGTGFQMVRSNTIFRKLKAADNAIQPIIAIQRALSAEEALIGTALAMFFQYFGGALLSGIAEGVLASSLRRHLASTVPGVDVSAVLAAGGHDLGHIVGSSKLTGVLTAYNSAIVDVFWVMTAAAIAMTFTCLGMGWDKSRA
ncbi:hypothetical protein PRZ48_012760 [Zasmidium cellare]|uniref:Uncharacterized protein n=1 Tax=Zasmidium cellare TaxID=395010 RepID=A0ABR0E5U0_ZASCE|nr:hypothetical protein PRZ48_012760 [Zasmidium cellare]